MPKPVEVHYPDNLSREAKEIVLILPTYISQLAQSQDRDWSFEFLPEARCAERILSAWLRVNIIRLVWTVLLDHPNLQEIHPAITLVRNSDNRVVDILIAEDLRPWLPDSMLGIPVELTRGGDNLDLQVSAAAS